MSSDWREDIAKAIASAGSESSAESALSGWASRSAEDERFADLVYQSSAMAYMGGNLFVRDVELADTAIRLVDVRVGSEGELFGQPFDLAVEQFAARAVVPPDEFYSDLDRMRGRAFTATRLATQSVRETAFGALQTHLQGGGDFASFAEAIRSEQVTLGLAPSGHGYLRTVFDTNVVSAYSAGRDRQLTDESVIEAVPYRIYQAVLDSRVRPEHEALHGLSWNAAETDEWRNFQGPNGFNCRCMVISSEERPEFGRFEAARHPEPAFDGPPSLEI